MTDNRTNEPSEAQVEAAARAIWATRYPESRPDIAEATWAEISGYGAWTPEALDIMTEARAALVAAAGAAPQAESSSITGAVVRTASGPCHIIYTAEGMSEEHKPGCGHKPILQPSITVDEVVK